jgi:hypothetical protein
VRAALPHRQRTAGAAGARPDGDAFTLLAAPLLGAWQPWGRLAVGEPVAGDVRTDPTVGADDLVPVEPFRTLRAFAYATSQAAR